jgi:response regulator RpfG family c-di-GMP phosphodiesterase
MPGLDGLTFLSRARAAHPDAVRLLLTGGADVQHAIEAVNQGLLFRFLTKPCTLENMCVALDAAVAQYNLVTAERDLLDKTLRGSLQVLGEVLALANPTAFGRALRAQEIIRSLRPVVPGAEGWEIDIAAILSQLGCVALPESILAAANRGAELPPEERKHLEAHPAMARDLLKPIPRLERLAEIIAYQDKPYLAPPRPGLEKCGREIPLGARLLKLALDFDALQVRGIPRPQAFSRLESRPSEYDPELMAALGSIIHRESVTNVREVKIFDLEAGMMLAEDLYSDAGVLLLSRGNPITQTLKRRLEINMTTNRSPKMIRVVTGRG